ncbi:MAG: hypothetical protein EAZ99_13145 [Alphaproteobacteria bacterium]|nr:MAG: hypothetical protein EAZ99_13145 [Alphaproteobacteria bacterium]
MRRLLLLSAVALVGSGPAVAQRISAEAEYQQCMALVQRDPAAAFERASSFALQGGGFPARHCAASALVRLRRHGEAAQRLEGLAQDVGRTRPTLGAEILAQAATSWQAADQPERAAGVIEAGLRLDQFNVDLRFERALLHAEAKRWVEAADDLTVIIQRLPRRLDVLVLRATAYRNASLGELAEQDIATALRLEPGNPEALVERAWQRYARGDLAGARQDFVAAAARQPDGPAGDMARRALEEIERR